LTVPLAGLVDLALLGHLDDLSELNGVALGTLIFDYIYWTFGFLRMSTTGLVARSSGVGDDREISAHFYRALFIALGVGIVLILLRNPIGSASFFILSGTSSEEGAGLSYFFARIWGAPAALGLYVVLGWLLGKRKAFLALMISVIFNGTNIFFD